MRLCLLFPLIRETKKFEKNYVDPLSEQCTSKIILIQIQPFQKNFFFSNIYEVYKSRCRELSVSDIGDVYFEFNNLPLKKFR